jgi:hypothetical protein
VARSTPVALRDLDLSCAVLKREQWDIAATLDQPLSAQDLAWQHGLALYDVIERLGGLVQAGLCMLRGNPAATPVPAGGTMLPRRNPPRSARAARSPATPRPAEPHSDVTPQSADPQPVGSPSAESQSDGILQSAESRSAVPQPGEPQPGVPKPGAPQSGGRPRSGEVPQSAEPQPGVPQSGGGSGSNGVLRPALARRPGGALRPDGNGNGSGPALTPAAPELLRRVLDGLKELS